jgi:hypothetical protein
MSTSLMPAPGPPGTTLLAAVMVMRSHRVTPGGVWSGCSVPVAAVLVVAWPRAVLTAIWLAIARSDESSSNWMPTLRARSTGLPKLIWIHWPSGESGSPSTHAVAGLRSNALTGSYCGDSSSHEPHDDAVTCAAPVRTATVWWPAAGTGSIWRGGPPAPPSGSSGGVVSVAV